MTLDELNTGQKSRVKTLACKGEARRRLMDFGLLPGTTIQVEFKSPLGDPVANRVRDTVIALRQIQAHDIEIEVIEEVES